MIRDPELHRGRNPQGFMDAAKIVVCDVQRHRSRMVLKFLAESIGEPGEAALLHAEGQVLPLDMASRDRRGNPPTASIL